MLSAATTSPFMMQQDEMPWVLWCSKEPLLILDQKKQTDGRYGNEDDPVLQPMEYAPQAPFIPQTNRYHAVLSRMDEARKKAASFSAWSH